MLVASQLGVVETIPVNFGGPRRILDALEQILSLRGPQNAIFGGLWIFTKNLLFYVKKLLHSFFLQNAALSHQTVLVASQFGVTESIPVIFEGARGILDALE